MRAGIDLGGTKIEGIILSDTGEILHRIRVATPIDDYQQTIESIGKIVSQLEKQAGRALNVGIGTPGTISHLTGRMKNCNSTCLNHHTLKHDLEQTLQREVKVENDANCFALSEARYGAGKESHSVFGVILGTGVGGGLIIGKQLLTGPNAIVGEWGHNQVPPYTDTLFPGRRRCYCGRSNCVESFLCGKGLEQTFVELGGAPLLAETISKKSSEGNQLANEALHIYCNQLAACLSTVVNIVDPQLIVFGGGLSNIDAIYEKVPELMLNYIFSDSVETRFVRPVFGDASGARGAACLWAI
ncbi:MAG: ROK family protein [Gammaproteobacteria bacterium]|nr:ROK family protein [Gammaproteobacteria bacterium]